jgi:hypothetical protein
MSNANSRRISVMNSRFTKFGCTILVVVAVVWIASPARATSLAPMDSAAFSYQYEMDVLPSAAGDFTQEGAGGSVSDGILTINAAGLADYTSQSAGQPYPGKTTEASGCTIDLRVKVTAANNTGYGVQAIPGPTNASQPCSELWITPTALTWGDSYTSLGTFDNASDYHVIRLAQFDVGGTAKYDVWRDGVLVANSIDPAFYNAGLERLIFGAMSGGSSSTSYTDYVRWTVGAYAPVPEPSGIAILVSAVVGLLAYAWRKRK